MFVTSPMILLRLEVRYLDNDYIRRISDEKLELLLRAKGRYTYERDA